MEDNDKAFFDGIAEIEKRHSLDYSIMDFIEYRKHPLCAVFINKNLSQVIKGEVIALNVKIFGT